MLCFHYLVILFICWIYSKEEYFLVEKGKNKSLCTEYSNPCSSVDYVMQTLLNNTHKDAIVYLDSGKYNYTITSELFSSHFYGYTNISFNLTKFILPFSSENNKICPIINFRPSDNYRFGIHLYSDISAAFCCIMFVVDNNNNNITLFYFITSFLLLLLLLFIIYYYYLLLLLFIIYYYYYYYYY
jgi:hypothetical protein